MDTSYIWYIESCIIMHANWPAISVGRQSGWCSAGGSFVSRLNVGVFRTLRHKRYCNFWPDCDDDSWESARTTDRAGSQHRYFDRVPLLPPPFLSIATCCRNFDSSQHAGFLIAFRCYRRPFCQSQHAAAKSVQCNMPVFWSCSIATPLFYTLRLWCLHRCAFLWYVNAPPLRRYIWYTLEYYIWNYLCYGWVLQCRCDCFSIE